jgi:hypothetical protein
MSDDPRKQIGSVIHSPAASPGMPAFSAPESEEDMRAPRQGWIPALATADEIRTALEKAFDYRGDVTITRKNGEVVEGYVFDRRAGGEALEECLVRMLPKSGGDKIEIRYSEIDRLEFSGKDTAAGKGFEAWIAQYRKKRASGEKNIFLAPEPLD